MNSRNFFLIYILEAGKYQIKVPADLVPGENPLPQRQLSSHCNLTGRKRQESFLRLLLLQSHSSGYALMT